ncbi:MAG: beta-lactamase family protein [Acidobacteria bacterium]|nr:beta-lactamase family protein [Acidobacteriota bacterium]
MNQAKILFCGIVLSSFLFADVSGQSLKAQRIAEYIDPFVKAGHFSGVVLASEDGKIIYERAFGIANAEYDIPNRLNTKFNIASITKSMTDVTLIRMVEAGKLGINDKLTKYIPDFPNGDKITFEMLARHRSGIPHRVTDPAEEAVAIFSIRQTTLIRRLTR